MSAESIAITSMAMLACLGSALNPITKEFVPECGTKENGINTANHNRLTATPFMPIYNNIGRNSDCPCGSRLKFKKCCRGKSL